DLHAELGQRLAGPGEGRELRVAVGAPRAAVDQDDAVGAGQIVRERNGAAADGGHRWRGGLLSVLQVGHGDLPLPRRLVTYAASEPKWTDRFTLPGANWTSKSSSAYDLMHGLH